MLSSPLRYPGGKSKVLDLIAPFWSVPHIEYREPFLGGGSVFLGKPKSQRNWLNDGDVEVANFWSAVADIRKNYALRGMVKNTGAPSVEMWRWWRDCVPATDVERAFRLLFLNRTSFSGVVGGGPIGGVNQDGPFKIDARWNPKRIDALLAECAWKLANARITDYDFEDVLDAPGRDVFVFLDPPYYHKGNTLYAEKMAKGDHMRLSKLLKRTPFRFLLTYDDCPEVRAMYSGAFFYEREWFYSASDANRRIGNELFISNFQIEQSKQSKLF